MLKCERSKYWILIWWRARWQMEIGGRLRPAPPTVQESRFKEPSVQQHMAEILSIFEDSKSKQYVLDFERRLQKQLRQFRPEEFAVKVAHYARRARSEPAIFAQCPPHLLVRALEANCAYWRQYYFKPLTDNDFRDSINLLHSFEDPYLDWAIRQDNQLFEFTHAMFRSQLELQDDAWAVPIGRAILLFADEQNTPGLSKAFSEEFGLSARRWIQILTLLWTRTESGAFGVRQDYFDSLVHYGISPAELQAFIAESTYSATELGRCYLKIHPSSQAEPKPHPVLWTQLRPCLSDRPIVKLENGLFLFPFPSLLASSMQERLIARVKLLDDEAVTEELGTQFERYLLGLIRGINRATAIFDSRSLLLRAEKSCDIAVVIGSLVLLIECKATQLAPITVSSRDVLDSPASNRVTSGFVQLTRTAHNIRNGRYDHLGISKDLTILPVVATLGSLPLFNSDTFWNRAMRACPDDLAVYDLQNGLTHSRPQVFNVAALEFLVLLLHRPELSLLEIWDSKIGENAHTHGDWEQSLRNKCANFKHDLTPWSGPVKKELEMLLMGTKLVRPEDGIPAP